ncbi:hypothetical protein CapIbe_019690 [Capra ibex]
MLGSTIKINFILLAFPHSLPDTRKQYFIFTTTFFITGICVFLALLLHYLYILKTTNIYKNMKITFLYPSFLLIFSTILFFLSGILCLCSTHHCWLQCVLVQPIQVKPMQLSVDNGNSVTERIPAVKVHTEISNSDVINNKGENRPE